MNAGILAPGYTPPAMPSPLLGQPQPVPMPYGAARDPYWDNVSLYLRMDGPHGSRTFTDLSKNRLTVSANGDAAVTGQIARFNQSATFDGSGDSLLVANNAALNVGSNDFTLEAWVRPTATSGTARMLWTRRNPIGFANMMLGMLSGIWTFWATSNGTSWNVVNQATIATPIVNAWQHIAIVRSGSSFTGYFNGVGRSLSTSTAAVLGNSLPLYIGSEFNGDFPFAGQIAEYRLTLAARYTSNFPPPTAPFPIGYQ